MAAGSWDCRAGAVAAVLGTLFKPKGAPAPVNPYGPTGASKPGPSPAEAAKVRRDVADAMFAEGLRQIARKAASRAGQPST